MSGKDEMFIDDLQEDIQELRTLLKEAHDKMDDSNADIEYRDIVCQWCNSQSWNASGIIHSKDCILLRMRDIEGVG